MLYMHAYILIIIGTHFACGRGPTGPRFVLGSSVVETYSVGVIRACNQKLFLALLMFVLVGFALHCLAEPEALLSFA